MSRTLGRGSRVLEVFADAMREELERNDHKPNWTTLGTGEALEDLMYHCAKLVAAVMFGNEVAVREYAADVANMAMIVGDVAGVLEMGPAPSPVLISNVFDVGESPRPEGEGSDGASELTTELGDAGRNFLTRVRSICQGPHWQELTSGKIGPL